MERVISTLNCAPAEQPSAGRRCPSTPIFMIWRASDHVRDEQGHLLRELHGVTLAQIIDYLVAKVGFPELSKRVPVKCFMENPSKGSSLTFLRRTPWARAKVEELYIELRAIDLREAQK